MKLKSTIAAVGVLLACGVGAGCSSDDEGTLQQSWTIQGGTNPNACTVSGATQMRIILVDASGFTQATNFASCGAFQTSQTLVEGAYTGTATFLGENGVAVSLTKVLPAFTIVAGQTTFQTIDFAATDLLAR